MRGLRYLREDRGATAVEYAILASSVAATIVVIALSIGAKNYQYFFRFDELFSSLF